MIEDGIEKQTNKKIRIKKKLAFLSGYLYVVPVLAGILIFTLTPMLVSLKESLTSFDPTAFDAVVEFTLDNYKLIFGEDRTAVWHSLLITFRYAIVMVPLSLCGSFLIALLISHLAHGQKTMMILLYLPALIPGVAGTLLWANITSTESWGYINQILDLFGIEPYTFYSVPETVFPTIILLSLNGWGPASIMWTAQIRNIPKELYEAAEIDGAGHVAKLIHITVPMCTSMLFYLLITNIIGALQVFGGYYPLIAQYPESSHEFNFIVVKIYREIYSSYGTSYACALSWLLFVIIGILTMFVFKTSKWVYYGEEK